MLTDNYINGKFQPAIEGATDQVVNPATGKVIGDVASSSAADVDAAVQAAAAPFAEWSAKTPRERSEILHKVADIVEENVAELSELE